MATISHKEAETLRWEYVVRHNLGNRVTVAQYQRLRAELGARVAKSNVNNLNTWLRVSFDPNVHPLDFPGVPYVRVLELLNRLREMQHARGLTRGDVVFLPQWQADRVRENTAWQREDMDPEWKQIMKTVDYLRASSVEGRSRFVAGANFRLQRLITDTGLEDGNTGYAHFLRLLGEQRDNLAVDGNIIRSAYTWDIRKLAGQNVDTSGMPTPDEARAAENEYHNQGPVIIVSSFKKHQASQQCAIVREVVSDAQKMSSVERLWLNPPRSRHLPSRRGLSDAFHDGERCYISNCPCHGGREVDLHIVESPVYYSWDHATREAEERKKLLRFESSGRVIQPSDYNQSQLNSQRENNGLRPICWFSHKITAHIRQHQPLAPGQMITMIGEELSVGGRLRVRSWRVIQQIRLSNALKLMDSCSATGTRITSTNFPAYDYHHPSRQRPIQCGDYLIDTGKMINPSCLPWMTYASIADFLSAQFGERAVTTPLDTRIHQMWEFIEANMPELRRLGVVTLPYNYREVNGVMLFTGVLSDVEGIDEDMLERNADQNGRISLPRTENALDVLRSAAAEEVEEEDEPSHLEDAEPVAAPIEQVVAPIEQVAPQVEPVIAPIEQVVAPIEQVAPQVEPPVIAPIERVESMDVEVVAAPAEPIAASVESASAPAEPITESSTKKRSSDQISSDDVAEMMPEPMDSTIASTESLHMAEDDYSINSDVAGCGDTPRKGEGEIDEVYHHCLLLGLNLSHARARQIYYDCNKSKQIALAKVEQMVTPHKPPSKSLDMNENDSGNDTAMAYALPPSSSSDVNKAGPTVAKSFSNVHTDRDAARLLSSAFVQPAATFKGQVVGHNHSTCQVRLFGQDTDTCKSNLYDSVDNPGGHLLTEANNDMDVDEDVDMTGRSDDIDMISSKIDLENLMDDEDRKFELMEELNEKKIEHYCNDQVVQEMMNRFNNGEVSIMEDLYPKLDEQENLQSEIDRLSREIGQLEAE